MIITMYRRKWKFSVMSAEDAENFIRQPHFECEVSIMWIMIIFLMVTDVYACVEYNEGSFSC